MFIVTTYDQGTIRTGTIDDLKRRECTWVHATGPTASELASIAEHVGIPAPDLAELLTRAQRPTLRELDGHSLIVFRSPREGKSFLTKPIAFLVSEDKQDVCTLTPYTSRSVEKVLALPEQRKVAIFARGATQLAYTIIEEIVASYFRVFDAMDEELARIEDAVRRGDVHAETMDRIYQLKKTLIYFHKALVGNREVIGAIEREYAPSLDPRLLAQFRILHDQIVQLVELDATYRDILTSTLEVHLSTISNHLNITVKHVTSWGAIILIPSLIASIFGMNFDLIPTAHAQWGFPSALGLMALATLTLYWYFKRKDWI